MPTKQLATSNTTFSHVRLRGGRERVCGQRRQRGDGSGAEPGGGRGGHGAERGEEQRGRGHGVFSKDYQRAGASAAFLLAVGFGKPNGSLGDGIERVGDGDDSIILIVNLRRPTCVVLVV